MQHVQSDLTRIDLNGDLGFRAEMKMILKQIHQATDLRLIEISWRAAPPVPLLHLVIGKQRRAVDDLLLKDIEILIGLYFLAGDYLIAAAEITQLMPKLGMHVQRQGTLKPTGSVGFTVCRAKLR
ncbi:hypothetical protein QM150_00130 [Klebsiella pneumoniae]